MNFLATLFRKIPRPPAKAVWLYIGGFACLALTALMNRHAGVSQGATEEGRQLLGAASIVIDVVGIVVMGSIAGNLLAGSGWGKKFMGGMVMVVVIGCAAFSITSIMSFVASEWISVAESRKAVIQAAKDREAAIEKAAKERREAQERLAQSGLGMMQAQVKDAGSKKERKVLGEQFAKGTSAMIAELGKEQQAPAKPAEPPQQQEIALVPDGGAVVANWLLNVPERTWQVSRSAAIAVLLILLKLFAFPLGGYYWGRKEERSYATIDVTPTIVVAALPAAEAPIALAAAPAPLQIAAAKPVEAKPVPAVAAAVGPEPAPEWRPLLEQMDFFAPRKGALREPLERKVLGYHWLTWLYAYGKTGIFSPDQVDRMYEEFCLSGWRESGTGVNVAKGELHAAALKLDKRAIERDKQSRWTITLKSPKRMRELLVKRGLLTQSTASMSQAVKEVAGADPKPEEAPEERVVPFAVASGVAGPPANDDTPRPAAAPAPAPIPVRGRAELQPRIVPNLEAMRALERVNKAAWRSRGHSAPKQHLHRFSRARAA